jgi:hypothetical protein
MRLDLARWALAALLAASAATAHARWYQVEVVVFRHAGGMASGGEQWPVIEQLPDFANSVQLVADVPERDDAGVAGPLAFQPLSRAEMRLDGVARKLRGGAYELLFASAWRQPSFGVAGARRVYLTDLDGGAGQAAIKVGPGGVVTRGTPTVAGTVSIKVARLLHVAVDFLYTHEGQPVRLTETRQVKLRETHYFDHPLFGVVVQVSPYVVPDIAATQEVGVDEPDDPEAVPEVSAPPGP